jgi:hypothetical protein
MWLPLELHLKIKTEIRDIPLNITGKHLSATLVSDTIQYNTISFIQNRKESNN